MVSTALISEALQVIERADPVYLTTVDPQGFPHTRAMFNLRNPSLFPQYVPFSSSRLTPGCSISPPIPRP